MPETPLLTYLRIQRAQDRQMMEALRKAAASVDAELRRLQSSELLGNRMRTEQLRRSQVAINNRLAQFWTAAGDTIQANTAKAAAAGAETILRESKSMLRTVLSEADYDYMMRSAQESAAKGLETLSQRVSGTSYVPLAESVYDNTALSQGKVDDIINSALARGASAAELARDVRGFVNPNTPGGLRYASMRLGRTEINNAFHASQIKQAQDEPWTLALLWNLSGSHPKPDACNDYADDVHFAGGEPGQWRPEEVPGKPHPNCLCYTTPETMSPDEFIEAFSQGKFDKYLDDEMGISMPARPDFDDAWIQESVGDRLQNSLMPWQVKDATWRAEARTSEYADAWESYASSSNAMNGYLRTGVSDPAAASKVDRMDKFIQDKGFELEEPMTVSRYIQGDWDPSSVFSEGAISRQPGFTSTTAMPMPGNGFTWMMQIRLPQGMRVVHGSEFEREVILPRGMGLRASKIDMKTKEVWLDAVPIN